jgi:uncharacterized Rmd1/YagE family protein
MSIIKETLEVLNAERQNRIGHNLEVYIILLIAVEIVISLLESDLWKDLKKELTQHDNSKSDTTK